MPNVEELESRIVSALDRVKASTEILLELPTEPDSELIEELEVERATNARLVETGQKNIARIERLETRLARLADRLETLDQENKRLNTLLGQMQDNNTALRAANADHIGDETLVNKALETENQALQASRAADLAELDDILAEITPLVKES